MTSEFEVMDSVCQNAIAYPDDDPSKASLRRSRVLDAMLIRNGQHPIFATLSEEEILTVGNQMVSLLRRRVGRRGIAELLEGQRMLREARHRGRRERPDERNAKRARRRHTPDVPQARRRTRTSTSVGNR